MDEKQLELFAEEGGFMSSGEDVDPVSGNEVPPGASPEEVRDDVDAKLSPNEYVVPADVLRYYGMKFFEDLRAQAKESLAEMDSEGRIGGEPMEGQEGSSEGLSEAEMQLLQQVMSEGGEPQFNQGGMVQRNPEFYAEGGMTNPPAFEPNKWADVGSSYFGSQQGSSTIETGSYYKTYVGPNGETRLILFINGEPSTPIPEGFTEQTTAADKVQEETAKEESLGRDEENDWSPTEDAETGKSWAEKNYDALNEDPISFGMNQLKGTGLENAFGKVAPRAGMALAGPVGGLVGGLASAGMQIENLGAAKAAAQIAKAKGLDTTGLETAIKQYESDLPGFTKTVQKLTNAGTGATYTDAYNSLVATKGVPSYVTQTDAMFKSSRTPQEAESRAQQIASQYGGGGDSNAEVRTEKAKTTEGTVSTIGGTGEGNAGVSVRSGSAAPTQSSRPSSRPERPGMAKGGLVKRRPKKSKK